MTDELLRDLAKDLPVERPTAARRDAIRSSLLVEAAESTAARPAPARRWPMVAAFTAGALAAAAIAVIVVRRPAPPIERANLAQVTATTPEVRIDHQIVATESGSDEIVRIRDGVIALAIPAQRRGDRMIVKTTTAEVEGDAGELEVTVANEQLQAVRVKTGTAKVVVIGQAPVILSAGQTWRASVITADLSPTQTRSAIDVATSEETNQASTGSVIDVATSEETNQASTGSANAAAKSGLTSQTSPESTNAATTSGSSKFDATKSGPTNDATKSSSTNAAAKSGSSKFDATKSGPTNDATKPSSTNATAKSGSSKFDATKSGPTTDATKPSSTNAAAKSGSANAVTNLGATNKVSTSESAKSGAKTPTVARVDSKSGETKSGDSKPGDSKSSIGTQPPVEATPSITTPPVVVVKPLSIEQRFKRGWDLLRAGKAQQAADELGAAADASPGAPLAADARYFQAVALVRANDPRAAERVLVQFLDGSPTSLRRGRAAVLLGRLLAERGDSKSARAWLESAANDPDPAIAAAAKAGLQSLE